MGIVVLIISLLISLIVGAFKTIKKMGLSGWYMLLPAVPEYIYLKKTNNLNAKGLYIIYFVAFVFVEINSIFLKLVASIVLTAIRVIIYSKAGNSFVNKETNKPLNNVGIIILSIFGLQFIYTGLTNTEFVTSSEFNEEKFDKSFKKVRTISLLFYFVIILSNM